MGTLRLVRAGAMVRGEKEQAEAVVQEEPAEVELARELGGAVEKEEMQDQEGVPLQSLLGCPAILSIEMATPEELAVQEFKAQEWGRCSFLDLFPFLQLPATPHRLERLVHLRTSSLTFLTRIAIIISVAVVEVAAAVAGLALPQVVPLVVAVLPAAAAAVVEAVLCFFPMTICKRNIHKPMHMVAAGQVGHLKKLPVPQERREHPLAPDTTIKPFPLIIQITSPHAMVDPEGRAEPPGMKELLERFMFRRLPRLMCREQN